MKEDEKPKAIIKSRKDIKFIEDQDLDSFKITDFDKILKVITH